MRWSNRRAASASNDSIEQGWTDAIRSLHPNEPMYTFWDYKRGRWGRDAGLRIDHLLISPSLSSRVADAGVDKVDSRRSGRQRPRPGMGAA